MQIGSRVGGWWWCWVSLTKSNGFPKDKLALAWLFDISESNLPGWMSLFEFILRGQATKARRKRVDKKLIEKYVRF